VLNARGIHTARGGLWYATSGNLKAAEIGPPNNFNQLLDHTNPSAGEMSHELPGSPLVFIPVWVRHGPSLAMILGCCSQRSNAQ
jgi:hypothetical protein